MTTDEHLYEIRNRASAYSFSNEGNMLAAEQLAKDVKWLVNQLENRAIPTEVGTWSARFRFRILLILLLLVSGCSTAERERRAYWKQWRANMDAIEEEQRKEDSLNASAETVIRIRKQLWGEE